MSNVGSTVKGLNSTGSQQNLTISFSCLSVVRTHRGSGATLTSLMNADFRSLACFLQSPRRRNHGSSFFSCPRKILQGNIRFVFGLSSKILYLLSSSGKLSYASTAGQTPKLFCDCFVDHLPWLRFFRSRLQESLGTGPSSYVSCRL